MNNMQKSKRILIICCLCLFLILLVAAVILPGVHSTSTKNSSDNQQLVKNTPKFSSVTDSQNPVAEKQGPAAASQPAGPNSPYYNGTDQTAGPKLPSETPEPTDTPAEASPVPTEPDKETPTGTPSNEDNSDTSDGELGEDHSHGSLFSEKDSSDPALTELLFQVTTALPQGNGSWGVYVSDLSKGTESSLNNQPMQAASLIKLFIMGAVYENYDALCQAYGADAMYSSLYSMITVSDNDAANTLVARLGGGDSAAGMQVVNSFCLAHNYTSTSMGRLLLQSNEFGDNYTSVSDCGRFLKEIYQIRKGTARSATLTHAEDMFSLLSQQTRRNKIPANMPAEAQVANKTGELADVENDAAIITTTSGTDLVICFMSENLSQPGAAQTFIAQQSRVIYDYYNH